MRVFHIATAADWTIARSRGVVRPASLEREGFVHLSFAEQLTASANRHFADADALVALELDVPDTCADLRVEDTYGSGTCFPHLYAAIAVREVRDVHALVRAPDGGWVVNLPDAGAPASPDH